MNDGVVTASDDIATALDDEPVAFTSGADGQSLRAHVERDINLARLVRRYYREDPVFLKILSQPGAHQRFGIRDKLIWMKSQMGRDVVCLPWKAFIRGRRLVEVIINQAHSTIGHYGGVARVEESSSMAHM